MTRATVAEAFKIIVTMPVPITIASITSTIANNNIYRSKNDNSKNIVSNMTNRYINNNNNNNCNNDNNTNKRSRNNAAPNYIVNV